MGNVGIQEPVQMIISKPSAMIQKRQQQLSSNPLGQAAVAALIGLPIVALAGAAAPAVGAYMAAEAAEAIAAEEIVPMLVDYDEVVGALDNTDFVDLDDI
jgi:hypothetical protein